MYGGPQDTGEQWVARNPYSIMLQQVRTPLKVSVWEECLRSHLDKEFSEYIIKGLKQGFRIDFGMNVGLQG